MEAAHSAEHFLAVGMQFLKLVLYKRSIQWSTSLNQTLAEHNQSIDFICVLSYLLLETLTHGQTQKDRCIKMLLIYLRGGSLVVQSGAQQKLPKDPSQNPNCTHDIHYATCFLSVIYSVFICKTLLTIDIVLK